MFTNYFVTCVPACFDHCAAAAAGQSARTGGGEGRDGPRRCSWLVGPGRPCVANKGSAANDAPRWAGLLRKLFSRKDALNTAVYRDTED